MSYLRNQGLSTMLKEGATHLEEPVIKNILACRELTKITRSSMGPNGLCKLIVNHLGKIFVTHDAATILSELEIEHPAANLLAMAVKAMQEEVGDGTNLVLVLAGESLSRAEHLLRLGLHTSDIISGYRKATELALEEMNKFVVSKVDTFLQPTQVLPAIRTALSSKISGYEDHFAKLCAEACCNACPKDERSFNVDNVRICKLEGGCPLDSSLVKGFAITRGVEGTLKHIKKARIAVYNCAIDVPSTETKGNVLLENADDLVNYSRKEEAIMDKIIGSISKMGVNVIVSQSTFGDIAMHFIERYGMMAIKVPSKFELRRLCAAINATTLSKVSAPTFEDIGQCDNVDAQEIGGRNIIVFSQDCQDSRLSTIIIRGSTSNFMDNVERALDDGVNVFKTLTRDGRLVAGGGAFEMSMQRSLLSHAESTPGVDQYVFTEFAKTFTAVPSTLAEVSGHNGTEAVCALESAHQAGKNTYGLDLSSNTPRDVVEDGLLEPLYLKHWAVRLAIDTAITILSIDQIIMAKPAGGPAMKSNKSWDED